MDLLGISFILPACSFGGNILVDPIVVLAFLLDLVVRVHKELAQDIRVAAGAAQFCTRLEVQIFIAFRERGNRILRAGCKINSSAHSCARFTMGTF